MESALLVTRSDKSISFFSDILHAAHLSSIVNVKSCGDARRLTLERDFDLIIINAPLLDEFGESFARHIASKGSSQVILVVKTEHFDAVSSNCENDGVLVVAKPINKTLLWAAIQLARAAAIRFSRLQNENDKLKQKIEDIRIIDRAKCILISHLNMSEPESHRYIEKQAMDMRLTKRLVAEAILRTYEN